MEIETESQTETDAETRNKTGTVTETKTETATATVPSKSVVDVRDFEKDIIKHKIEAQNEKQFYLKYKVVKRCDS